MTTNIYWFLIQKEDLPPAMLYEDVQFKKTIVPICPQTVALDKRTLVINMPFNLTLQRKEDGSYYAESTEVVGQSLWEDRPVLAIDTETKLKGYEEYPILHIKIPYIFLTENKNITYYLQGPKSNTKHSLKNVIFAEGMLSPGQYARAVDVAMIIPNNEKVTFVKGEPLVYLYFSDDINLKEIIPNQPILNYMTSIYGVTNYVRGVRKIFKKASRNYPYKELKNCEIVNAD